MKITSLSISIIIALVINLQAFGQNLAQSPTTIVKQDFCHFSRTGLTLVKTPLEFKTKEWLTTTGIIGTTALLFAADKEIRRAVQQRHSHTNDHIFNFDQVYGNGYTVLLTAGVYGLGLVWNKPGLRLTGLRAAEAFAYSGLITAAGKFIIGRRRPYAGEGQLFFKPFQNQNTYYSLPSGHSTVAFAVSTLLAKSLDNTWWKIVCYGSSSMVAASRIYHNAHWFSDAFLGSVVGYIVAVKVVNRDAHLPRSSSGCCLSPRFSLQGIGVAAKW